MGSGGKRCGALVATAAASAAAATFLGLIAIAAEDRPVAARFKGNSSGLAATGADDRGVAGLAALVAASPTAGLFVLAGLAALFAAFGEGIAAL